MENYKYLKITILLLFVSIVYYLLYSKKTFIKECLVGMLFVTIFFTQLFWNEPIKTSFIHKIDALFAKIAIFSFIIYIMLFKLKNIYLIASFIILLSFVVTSFYFSNYYSTNNWCSNKHIISHGFLHFFCFIATFYSFV
jgi:hypothetical protein